jgi:nucleotide sugar dehydrogenase
MEMNKKKVAIVGFGYVGKAMHNLFKSHYEVYVHDPFIQGDFADVSFQSMEYINSNCELGIVCVPTPRADNGECDVSTVDSAIEKLNTPLILLKSTIEIGTTDKLKEKYRKNIVFSPEYCGESTYWSPYLFDRDIKETPFFIFGGDQQYTTKMVEYFLPITGPTKKYVQCSAKEAEITKYMENSFYSTKIAYCYEMYEVCRAAGIDWNRVRELWLLDPRVNPMHTAVFNDNDRPFSGKCFPKDTSAIVEFAKKVGYEPELLKEVLKTNDRIFEIRKTRRE